MMAQKKRKNLIKREKKRGPGHSGGSPLWQRRQKGHREPEGVDVVAQKRRGRSVPRTGKLAVGIDQRGGKVLTGNTERDRLDSCEEGERQKRPVPRRRGGGP